MICCSEWVDGEDICVLFQCSLKNICSGQCDFTCAFQSASYPSQFSPVIAQWVNEPSGHCGSLLHGNETPTVTWRRMRHSVSPWLVTEHYRQKRNVHTPHHIQWECHGTDSMSFDTGTNFNAKEVELWALAYVIKWPYYTLSHRNPVLIEKCNWFNEDRVMVTIKNLHP